VFFPRTPHRPEKKKGKKHPGDTIPGAAGPFCPKGEKPRNKKTKKTGEGPAARKGLGPLTDP